MKTKITITTALIFIVSFNLHSQISGWGIGGGGSASTFEYLESSQFDSDNSTKTGLTGGIRLDFNLFKTDLCKFSPEFFFVQNGSKGYYTSFNALLKDYNTVNLNYVGLYSPFTFFLPFGSEENDTKYHGLMLQGKVFMDYAVSGNVNGNEDLAFADFLDKFDLGYAFELGFVYQGFKIMLGYNHGIKNIEFTSSLTGEAKSVINNRGLTLQLGVIERI